eukprot:TRINITY_DN17198_c2_g1_i1.p1 TRINITY_DN17198_c2_g1~~TRINITY_DN17198_c2_g1_i1.p1  ORF type:complete len:631 (-),score=141.20 TRINITY_DN17198_c2_g1_i1:141-2033(-)
MAAMAALDSARRVPSLDLINIPRASEDEHCYGRSLQKAPSHGSLPMPIKCFSSHGSPQTGRVLSAVERRPLQVRSVVPQLPSSDVEVGGAALSAGSTWTCANPASKASGSAGNEVVRSHAVPWVPVRKCAGHRPAPRITRVSDRKAEHQHQHKTVAGSGQSAGSDSAVSSNASASKSRPVSAPAPTTSTPAAVPQKSHSPSPQPSSKSHRSVEQSASAQSEQSKKTPRLEKPMEDAPRPSSAPGSTGGSSKNREQQNQQNQNHQQQQHQQQRQSQQPLSLAATPLRSHRSEPNLPTQRQPQPPPMPPPRQTPRRRAAAMLALAEGMSSRVLRRKPPQGGSAKALQRKPSMNNSVDMSLSCIEVVEEAPSSDDGESECSGTSPSAAAAAACNMAGGLQLGELDEPRQTRTPAARATSAPALIGAGSGLRSALKRSVRSETRRKRRVSWRSPAEESVIAVTPRASNGSSCGLRWATSLLSGECLPPDGPPPLQMQAEQEIDMLKAALEETLALVPKDRCSDESQEDDCDEDEEMTASVQDADEEENQTFSWTENADGYLFGEKKNQKNDNKSLPSFEGDENDPLAANRFGSSFEAWAPRTETSETPSLSVTWKSPAKNKVGLPVGLPMYLRA